MDFLIDAVKRDDVGTSHSRSMRGDGLVPGIIYGLGDTPEKISLKAKELRKSLEIEAFYSHIIELNIDGKKQQVILKDIQRHPSKKEVLHIDFFRVKADEKLKVTVPLHFLNETTAPGVKIGGGIISRLATDLEIICLPKDIPEYIEVDLINLELDETIHLKDIKLPENVESVLLQQSEDNDIPIVVIHKPKAEVIEEEVETPEGEEEGAEGGEQEKASSEEGKKDEDAAEGKEKESESKEGS